jgi:D-inositol-3-phosphate glycosyltransferase
MRLGLVVPSLLQGGGVPTVARFIKDIVLRDGRFDLKVISLSTSARDEASLRLTSPPSWFRGARMIEGRWDGLPCLHVGAVGAEFEFQRYRPRRRLTDALGDCDIIQVVCGSPAWANAVIGLGKPVALQVATRVLVERHQRDARPRSVSAWWRKGMTEVTNRIDDRVLRRVDAIQVENRWMQAYAADLNKGRTVDLRYAPPGINTSLFHPLAERGLSASPYVLCVGRFDDPRKRIELLLDAYSRLPAPMRDDVRLVLAGSAAPPPSFWGQVDRLGLRDQVSFVDSPSTEKLVKLYQEARVFALASDEEGLGLVLLEAMACGIPVVSTRSGGPDDIITDGKDGYLLPLDDALGLSLRLRQLLQNDEKNAQMGVNARRTIEARYDERTAGETFLDMWDRLSAARLHL